MTGGRRVTLFGLGRHGGGVGAARWLASQGARLTITDLADAGALADSVSALADLPIERWRLGQHVADDFTAADVVVVNPAIKPEHPLLELARSKGAQITSEIELFLHACPATVIGITGSNGKSTTASLTAAMVEAAGRRVWLGGNIGVSLLPQLAQMCPEDVAVLELSSFQLHYLSANVRGPRVAIVTNCTANHLDWHGSYDHYVQSKQRLLRLQDRTDVAVLNTACPEVQTWKRVVQGCLLPPWPDERVPRLTLLGSHNRVNAAIAAAAAEAIGCSESAIYRAMGEFCGLPHRLELVAERNGRRFINDSKATTPEAAIAALRTVESPVWLLAGGHAKGGNYAALAAAISDRVRGVACFGQSATMLAAEIRRSSPDTPLFIGSTLALALRWCWKHSQSGDHILLSPACASFDQYRDYAERGECFRGLVRELT